MEFHSIAYPVVCSTNAVQFGFSCRHVEPIHVSLVVVACAIHGCYRRRFCARIKRALPITKARVAHCCCRAAGERQFGGRAKNTNWERIDVNIHCFKHVMVTCLAYCAAANSNKLPFIYQPRSKLQSVGQCGGHTVASRCHFSGEMPPALGVITSNTTLVGGDGDPFRRYGFLQPLKMMVKMSYFRWDDYTQYKEF